MKTQSTVMMDDDSLFGPPLRYIIDKDGHVSSGTPGFTAFTPVLQKEMIANDKNLAAIEKEYKNVVNRYLEYAKSRNKTDDIEAALTTIRSEVEKKDGKQDLHAAEAALFAIDIEWKKALDLDRQRREKEASRKQQEEEDHPKEMQPLFKEVVQSTVELKSYKVIEKTDEVTGVVTNHLVAEYVRKKGEETTEFSIYFSVDKEETVRRNIKKHDTIIVTKAVDSGQPVQNPVTLYQDLNHQYYALVGVDNVKAPNRLNDKAAEIKLKMEKTPNLVNDQELKYAVLYMAYHNAKALTEAEARVNPRDDGDFIIRKGTPAVRTPYHIPDHFTKVKYSIAIEKKSEHILKNLAVEYSPDSRTSSLASMGSEELLDAHAGYRSAVFYPARASRDHANIVQNEDVDGTKKMMIEAYSQLIKANIKYGEKTADELAESLEKKVTESGVLNSNNEAEFLSAYLIHQNALTLQVIKSEEKPKEAVHTSSLQFGNKTAVQPFKKEDQVDHLLKS